MDQIKLLSPHAIAQRIERTHRSVTLCIARLKITPHARTAGNRELYTTDDAEKIAASLRAPNTKRKGEEA